MKFFERDSPAMDKPLIIAAMPDMGNIGEIVIDFINRHIGGRIFRIAQGVYPDYVMNDNGTIQNPKEEWAYRYADGLITFGGSGPQPREGPELHSICQDVIDMARRHSAAFIYTVGGFYTSHPATPPHTLAATTTEILTRQVRRAGIRTQPGVTIIRGFNGIILGHARAANISL